MTTVDAKLVARICRQATSAQDDNSDRSADGHPLVIAVLADPLDGTIWVQLASWPRARQARRALTEFGIAAVEAHDARLHVTGWDVRLLRRRLSVLLAGVDDLTMEWDATAELASYHYDRRAASGEDPDPADVLADVEATMRRATPLPHRAPSVTDIDTLLHLIDAAEDAYDQLISQHLEHAEQTLARRCAPGAA